MQRVEAPYSPNRYHQRFASSPARAADPERTSASSASSWAGPSSSSSPPPPPSASSSFSPLSNRRMSRADGGSPRHASHRRTLFFDVGSSATPGSRPLTTSTSSTDAFLLTPSSLTPMANPMILPFDPFSAEHDFPQSVSTLSARQKDLLLVGRRPHSPAPSAASTSSSFSSHGPNPDGTLLQPFQTDTSYWRRDGDSDMSDLPTHEHDEDARMDDAADDEDDEILSYYSGSPTFSPPNSPFPSPLPSTPSPDDVPTGLPLHPTTVKTSEDSYKESMRAHVLAMMASVMPSSVVDEIGRREVLVGPVEAGEPDSLGGRRRKTRARAGSAFRDVGVFSQ